MNENSGCRQFQQLCHAHAVSRRRDFFAQVATGTLGAALAPLLVEDLLAGERPQRVLLPQAPHFRGKATALIQFFMTGGPSQVDLFDPKPALKNHEGELPRAFLDNVESVGAAGGLLPSPFKFRKRGESGLEIADVMPHLAQCADDLAIIRSMWTTRSMRSSCASSFCGVYAPRRSGGQLTAAQTRAAWIRGSPIGRITLFSRPFSVSVRSPSAGSTWAGVENAKPS